MINPKQFLELIIRPTLEYLDMGGEAAERLLLGTALTESRLEYLAQYPEGPARGVYQLEPATEDDIGDNYLAYREELMEKVLGLALHDNIKQFSGNELVGNLYYATAMARIHYKRVPQALPDKDDAGALCDYYLIHYNTRLGASTKEKSIWAFEKAIEVCNG